MGWAEKAKQIDKWDDAVFLLCCCCSYCLYLILRLRIAVISLSLSLSLWEMRDAFHFPVINFIHAHHAFTHMPLQSSFVVICQGFLPSPPLLPVFPPTRPARILLSRSKERVKPQFWLQARNKFPRVNLSSIFKPADINCVKKWSSCRDKLIVILKNLFLMNTNLPRFVMHTILPA